MQHTPEAEYQDPEFEREVASRLRAVYSATPWLVATEIVAGGARQAAELTKAGAPSVMILGATRGTGRIEPAVPHVSLDQPAVGDIIESMRAYHGALAAPPVEALAAIDRWDPLRRARVFSPMVMDRTEIAGRPVFGPRPDRIVALEDKMVIDEVLLDAGLRVAPSIIVDLSDTEALSAAHRRLAGPRGTVWAADNDQGLHGGAAGTRWVPDRAAVATTRDELAVAHRRVRVMPFLEGVPCSVHGMVVGDHVVAFRPCELLVLRDLSTNRFRYARAGTFWDPEDDVRREMRDAAVRLGRHLSDRVDYRGVYTLDGVATSDGFLPTEVNPRYGAALPSRHPTTDGGTLNLYLLSRAVLAGHLDDLDASRLERWVLARLDRDRQAASWLTTTNTPATSRSGLVTRTAAGLALAENETGTGTDTDGKPDTEAGGASGPADAEDILIEVDWVEVGGRGSLDLNFGPATPVGPPLAPLLAEAAALIEARWGVGLPELEAATG